MTSIVMTQPRTSSFKLNVPSIAQALNWFRVKERILMLQLMAIAMVSLVALVAIVASFLSFSAEPLS